MTPTYLDCAATTPVLDEVREEVIQYLVEDFGNAGSRTHEYGARAKKRIHQARAEVAALADASPDGVVFTSGATEANNLAILGLAPALAENQRRHLVTTTLEHKSVLEPMAELARRGFEVSYVGPRSDGLIYATDIASAVREDTGLVSIMHVNNETGAIQPISELASLIADSPAYLHVDAAQGFGKVTEQLDDHRIDLISCSAHKVFGPKGVGALLQRRRGFERVPLEPLMFGGGQERGLRPGTQPVHLIAGLGCACTLALRELDTRQHEVALRRDQILEHLGPLSPQLNVAPEHGIPNILSMWLPNVDAEALLVATKDVWAVSVGSACTSQRYEPSHVLTGMGLSEARVRESIRISASHLTDVSAMSRVVGPALELRASRDSSRVEIE